MEKSQTFDIKGYQFIVAVRDLLSAPVDGIVNPANSGLSHGGGVAGMISDAAGQQLIDESDAIITQQGSVPVSHAVLTSAGLLPYKGIIHTVGPRQGDGKERLKIIKAVVNSLVLANQSKWESIAFPAISTGIFCVSQKDCAVAFARAVPYYWEKANNNSIKTIWLCLTMDSYQEFVTIIETELKKNQSIL